MKVEAYLFFNGRTAEAVEFYKKAIGAKPEKIIPYSENPAPEYNPPGSENKVMHTSFLVGDTRILASDGDCNADAAEFKNVSLTITADSAEQAERIFSALSEGGEVQMPLGETFFSPKFGMLKDKFGVAWMVILEPQS